MEFAIDHLHFKTPDPVKTAQWYVEALGAKIVSQADAPNGVRTYRLDLHGVPMNVTGYVAGQKLEQYYGMEHLALNTDEFDGMLQRLKDRGARILEERNRANGGRVAFFEGPEGVRMELMENL